MRIAFATCEVHRALEFINQVYPSYEDLTEKDIPKLRALLEKDIVRVQDPNFHQPCQIIAGNNYSEEYDKKIGEAIQELQDSLRLRKE